MVAMMAITKNLDQHEPEEKGQHDINKSEKTRDCNAKNLTTTRYDPHGNDALPLIGQQIHQSP
jgi:lipopolysaccharide export system protein LptC